MLYDPRKTANGSDENEEEPFKPDDIIQSNPHQINENRIDVGNWDSTESNPSPDTWESNTTEDYTSSSAYGDE